MILLALIGGGAALWHGHRAPSEAPTGLSISADRGARDATTPQMVFDGKVETGFYSAHDDWQYVQVEFPEEVLFNGLRRHMRGGADRRVMQGEGASWSQDGHSYTKLLGETTTGWEGYTNYKPHAWHSVPYGWSEWLRPDRPVRLKYLRFQWDGDDDILDEVELDTRPVPKPPAPGETGQTTTRSGLGYTVLRQGSSPVTAARGDEVVTHYAGWLVDGTQLDSSWDRGQPLTVPLGQEHLIRGLEEGVLGMREGEVRRLYIPPDLAYGRHSPPGGRIPPNATLIFEVELVDVNKNGAP